MQEPKAVGLSPSWFTAAMMLLLGQLGLYSFLRLRPGTVAFIPYFVGPKLLFLVAGVGLAFLLFQLARKRSLRLLGSWRLWTSVAALVVVILISVFGYKVYPSSHDGKPSSICFRLPLDGEVAVMQGGASLEVNYHAAFPAQRYAYDLALAREGKTHRGEGYVVWDYYVYGQPVHAPAEGFVIYTSDGDPDQSPSDEGWLPYKSVGGNHIVLEIGKREYLYLGHLQLGTIRVKPGDRVTTGQELGRAGNSGRSENVSWYTWASRPSPDFLIASINTKHPRAVTSRTTSRMASRASANAIIARIVVSVILIKSPRSLERLIGRGVTAHHSLLIINAATPDDHSFARLRLE